MPSGYLSTLPTDVLLDTGILYLNSSTAYGVSDGGIAFDPGKEWQNIDFDGKRSPMYGLDRVVGYMPKVSGTLIALNATTALNLEPGGSSSTVGGVTTITPASASGLLSQASPPYLQNVRVAYQRGGGGLVIVRFEYGLWTKWSLRGQDKEKARIDFEIEARLSPLAGASPTDTPPYQIQLAATLP